MIYDLAPDRLWLQLVLEIGHRGGQSGTHGPSDIVTLFISIGSIFEMDSLISTQSSRTIEVPWDSWAKHTAWIDTTNYLRPGAGCFYGSRAVYLARTTELLHCKAVIYDLTFRGTTPSSRVVSNNALTSAELHMQAVFKGSRQPAVICTFNLKEELVVSQHVNTHSDRPIAMIDEEHGSCFLFFLSQRR